MNEDDSLRFNYGLICTCWMVAEDTSGTKHCPIHGIIPPEYIEIVEV